MTRTAIVPLACLAWAAAGLAQTGYYELIPWQYRLGPTFDYPLFAPVFTSGSYFNGVWAGRDGALFVSDGRGVQKITREGTLVPITGYGPASVAPGERVWALLAAPSIGGVAQDSHGNVYIGGGNGIFRIAPDGVMELFSSLRASSLAIGPNDDLYALVNGIQVVRMAGDGSAVPVAGTGEAGFGGDGGPATAAQIRGAYNIAVDGAGNLWIADSLGDRIRKVDANGIITTAAEVPSVYAIAAGVDGSVYFGLWDSNSVKRLTPAGAIANVGSVTGGVWGLAVDSAGRLFIATRSSVAMADDAGGFHRVAGCLCGGDGGPSVWARVAATAGLVRDAAGNTYFSDPVSSVVRRIAPDGTILTVAGNGDPGFSGDGGPARNARLSSPTGLAIDVAGNLYIADEQNNRIRKVTPSGIIQTVAGDGEAKFAGDGGPATAASLGLPDGVAVDSSGNIYIADTASHRIRKVTLDGIIQTIAGSGQFGTAGDGGPAVLAQLINPRGLAVDSAGNLFITDSSARMVRRITPSGIIERFAGTGEQGSRGNGGPAVAAQVDFPWAITVDGSGNVLFSDGNSIRKVDRAGIIQSVGGAGTAKGIAAESNGNLWFATGNTVAVLAPGGPPFPLPPAITPELIDNAALVLPFSYPVYPSVAVAPGEIIAIAGARLGQDTDGTRVLFDGEPATVLAVRNDQVIAVAPYGITGKTTVGVTVEVNGISSNVERLVVLSSVPQLFTNNLGTLVSAATLNQDGTRNGPDNAAHPGSVVSLFATGAGEMISSEPLPVPKLTVSVTLHGHPADIVWAGAAPGLPGAFQVNVRIPNDLVPAPLPNQWNYYWTELRVGNGKSAGAYVWVTP